MTLIQFLKGDNNSAVRRTGLSEAQRTGQACLVCSGTEDLNTRVGWVEGVEVRVHSYHLGHYQLGETIPPPTDG